MLLVPSFNIYSSVAQRSFEIHARHFPQSPIGAKEAPQLTAASGGAASIGINLGSTYRFSGPVALACTPSWRQALSADPLVEYFKGSEVWEKNEAKETPFGSLTTEQGQWKVGGASVTARRLLTADNVVPDGMENPQSVSE
jgi:hypothetical protein